MKRVVYTLVDIIPFLILIIFIFIGFLIFTVENSKEQQDSFCKEEGWDGMEEGWDGMEYTEYRRCYRIVKDSSGLGINKVYSGDIEDEYFNWLEKVKQ